MDFVFDFLVWPALIVVIMAAVIGWDRWRRVHRDPYLPTLGVVRAIEARDAIRLGNHLLDIGGPVERAHALGHFTIAAIWLRSERHYGSAKRRIRLAHLLDLAELGLEQARTAPTPTD